MKADYVVGIDGGNTKSIAVVATMRGEVVGAAAGGCTDIYGADSPQQALELLVSIVRTALDEAGIRSSAVRAAVGSLAGADWPEDYELYRHALATGAELSGSICVMNDGVGPVRLAGPSGVGVAVAVGTGAAVGARGPTGAIWHGSFWLPVGGASWLGRKALAAVYQAALGIGASTSLSATLLQRLEVTNEEEMLHTLTRRGDAKSEERHRIAGACLLDADAAGDAVARSIIADYATQLAPYALVAAEKVSLDPDFTVVLAGGVLRHPASTLPSQLTAALRVVAPRAVILRSTTAPVLGAVLEALAQSGVAVTRDLMATVADSSALAKIEASPTGGCQIAKRMYVTPPVAVGNRTAVRS